MTVRSSIFGGLCRKAHKNEHGQIHWVLIQTFTADVGPSAVAVGTCSSFHPLKGGDGQDLTTEFVFDMTG